MSLSSGDWFGLIVALAVFAYLVYALFRGEQL
jgi:K+-transporting ATPase KdpF subunit